MRTFRLISLLLWLLSVALHRAAVVHAEPPSTEYIFPAGGQRGTTVDVRVGAHYLHGAAPFSIDGPGIEASAEVRETKTVWFEGPMIFKPASQGAETYPKDHAGQITIAGDAPLGYRRWRVQKSQGITASQVFVIGDLPEVVEQEIDGAPIVETVELPVTINGRIFPREDVDIWEFTAQQGDTVRCQVAAAAIGSQLDSVLEIYDSEGRQIAMNDDPPFGAPTADSALSFTAPTTGKYQVRIYDVEFRGFQRFVYRLTIDHRPAIRHIFPLGGQSGTPTRFEVTTDNATAPIDVTLPNTPGRQEVAFTVPGIAHPLLRLLDIADQPDMTEDEAAAGIRSFPVAINGRITAEQADRMPLTFTEDGKYRLVVLTRRLGSLLDAEVMLQSVDGKTIFQGSEPTSPLETGVDVSVKAGEYVLEIRSQYPQEFGPAHAYRVKLAPAAEPDFALSLESDAINVDRGATVKVKVNAQRIAGHKAPIDVNVQGLIAGVVSPSRSRSPLERTAARSN